MSRRAPAVLLLPFLPFFPFVLASAVAGSFLACSNGSGATQAPVDAGSPDDASAIPDVGFVLTGARDAMTGGACDATADCPNGLLCLYAVAEACAAHGVCEELAASSCAGPYCTCRGDTAGACGGYAELPMVAPLHGPPCGGAEDAGGDD